MVEIKRRPLREAVTSVSAIVSVVVDTSVLFSFLLRTNSTPRRIFLANSTRSYYCPRFVLVELFKHKERMARATELTEEELLECLNEMLAHVRFVEEGSIPIGTWIEARRLCRDIDPKDTPFVALAIHLGAELWTDDAELKAGLTAKGIQNFFRPQ